MLDISPPDLTQGEWIIHGAIFSVNLLLLAFSKTIINKIDPGQDHRIPLRFFISINILFLLFHTLDLLLMTLQINYQHIFIKLAYSGLCIYLSAFTFKIGNVLIRKRFGKSKVFDSEQVYQDSYSSRLVEIIFLVVIFLFTTYSLIKIWGMDSLLETTGIFGIVIGFMALTSNVWAPDILSGLIILNTNILEDGDVVIVDGYPDEYIIHKVSFIYTILYDIRNNHRTFIRNKRFIESKIDNLSRLASTDGIRKALTYKISYPKVSEGNKSARLDEFKEFTKKIDKLFTSANEIALQLKDNVIKPGKAFEWQLTNAGDYALEYTLFVYLEAVPSTKITALARRHVVSSLFGINASVYEASVMLGVELKTPSLITLEHEADYSPIVSK